jgi:hypothetical protein
LIPCAQVGSDAITVTAHIPESSSPAINIARIFIAGDTTQRDVYIQLLAVRGTSAYMCTGTVLLYLLRIILM